LKAEVSSAVLEMKPFSISARLLSNWRCAMSICTLAALAWSCAWRSRAWYSVGSMRATTWPALTASPSRTVSPCNSPGTRALTKAVVTALSAPVTGRPCSSSRICARVVSVAANSTTVTVFAAAAWAWACCWALRADSTRAARPATRRTTTAATIHFHQRFMRSAP
jgi:hypothetical protein